MYLWLYKKWLLYIEVFNFIIYKVCGFFIENFKERFDFIIIFMAISVLSFELIILRLNFNKKNLLISISYTILLPIAIYFSVGSEIFWYILITYLLIFMYRTYFLMFLKVIKIYGKGESELNNHFYFTIMLQPFFIHRLKREMFKLMYNSEM